MMYDYVKHEWVIRMEMCQSGRWKSPATSYNTQEFLFHLKNVLLHAQGEDGFLEFTFLILGCLSSMPLVCNFRFFRFFLLPNLNFFFTHSGIKWDLVSDGTDSTTGKLHKSRTRNKFLSQQKFSFWVKHCCQPVRSATVHLNTWRAFLSSLVWRLPHWIRKNFLETFSGLSKMIEKSRTRLENILHWTKSIKSCKSSWV